MKVDFNNLRKQACYAYDSLCEKLNSSIFKNDEYVEFPNGRYDSLKDCVVINTEDIQKDMESLRQLIGTIAMVHEPNDPDFADVYPTDKSMTIFNEQS